ncbi:MarR family transcriptional regulator [Burkholderia sp. Leaf177]|uniref:MarR family winged helix-turn-helix transcriptional regulator n=1 Tax=Burkholderia sp. Leaf177 TaxID=1736287 RepID=UPI0006F296E2|nr:MarR family winged helix-turn-helix transcriptional regulator [Burkholderia sp. Leaf177]KQR74037.1 MarR family transcriptional regulator [Burkholderia sp. Leaf177]
MHTPPFRHDDCFALRQAARHISQLYERHLSAAGITPTQFSIVSALERAPDMTMAELAQAMVMERTTVVRTLQPLLRSGLVSAELGGTCQRRLQLTLTESGRTKLADAQLHFQAAQEEFETKFGRRQAARLRRELFRLTSE